MTIKKPSSIQKEGVSQVYLNKGCLYKYQKTKLKRVPLDAAKEKYEQISAAKNEKVNGCIKRIMMNAWNAAEELYDSLLPVSHCITYPAVLKLSIVKIYEWRDDNRELLSDKPPLKSVNL